jgi:NADPH:quinone reductase-like Zn-dependent oxidoreductase/thioesterase domain-containing protein/acyl carrier protein
MTARVDHENQRLCIGTPGLLDSLELVPEPRLEPGPGEVEIEVHAAGLNFQDVLLALGMLPAPGDGQKLGRECAGRVVRCGAGVRGVFSGDRVLATGESCFRPFVTVRADAVAPVPDALSYAEAATIPIAFMTAHYALHHLGRLRRGDSVLIHAAAGGVGLAAVALAQRAGATIFATAGTEEKRAFLRSLGILHVMDSRSLAFADEILALTGGRGVDVVLNSLSGEFIDKGIAILAPNGRFLEMGKRDIFAGRQIDLGWFSRGISFSVVGGSSEIPDLPSLLADVMDLFRRGELRPLPRRVFPSNHIASAFALMARAGHIGKIVVAFREDAEDTAAPAVPARSAELSSALRSDASSVSAPEPRSAVVDLTHSMSPAEGVAAFQRALASGLPQVVVSTVPLLPRLTSGLGQIPSDITAARQASSPSSQPNAVPTAPAATHPRPSLATPFVAPSTDLERSLAEIWQTFLGIDRVGVEDRFQDLGGDSLMAVQLLATIRARLKVRLSSHSLLVTPTIAGLSTTIARQQRGLSEELSLPRCIVPLRAGSARPALFLVHPVGGHIYLYRDLTECLGADQPVYGLHAADAADPSTSPQTVEGIAEQYLKAVRAVQPEGPYVLGGSSFGGMLAYEMAQQLSEAGQQVGFVMMLDTAAPRQVLHSSADEVDVLAYLMSIGNEWVSPESLRRLTREQQWRAFCSRSPAAARLPPLASEEMMEPMLNVLRTCSRAPWEYQPRPTRNRILFFRCTEKDRVNPPAPESGWLALAHGGLDLFDVPGNHITMCYHPNVHVIAERFAEYLASLRAPPTLSRW